LSLIIGLSTNAWIDLPIIFSVIFISIALATALVCAIFFSKRCPFILICVAAIIAGMGLGSLQMDRASRVMLPEGNLDKGQLVICDGRLLDDPVWGKITQRFDSELLSCREPQDENMLQAKGGVRVYSRGGMDGLAAGNVVRFQARLKKPRDFRNPGAFSWRRFLQARGIGAVGSVTGPDWMVKLPVKNGRNFSRVLTKIRHHLDSQILKSTSREASGVLRAMVLGDKTAVSKSVRSSFQDAGIAHLLAISGLHVGYLALLVYLLFRLIIGRWTYLIARVPLQKAAAAMTLPLVWCFIILVGAPVSAVRAGIMISVYLFGTIFGLRQDLLTTLAVAALIIVILEPLAIFDVSFQLSFVSVLAIILIVPRITWPIKNWFARRSMQLVAVTIAATIGSAPLVAYHFHLVTGLGLITNLFAVPWTGIVVLPSIALASIFPILWPLSGWAVDVLIGVAKQLSSIGSPLIFHVAPNLAELMLIYAGIVVLVFWKSLPYRRWCAGAVAAGLLFNLGWWHIRPLMTNTMEVTFIDVGQGDSALIRFPGGETMLIDGGGLPGGEFDIGEHVVVPAILKKGIHQIDRLVLSHPHHDHYRGLGTVAERFHPKELWMPNIAAPEQEFEFWGDFLGRVESAGVRIKEIDAKTEPMDIGGVKVSILHPNGKLPADIDPNDTSIVLKLTYGDVSFLFTGDLTEWGEQSLLRNGADPKSAILKVAHHGSETSNSREFLRAVSPKIAVISVGQYNRYHMPDAIVLDLLEEVAAKIYRTDLQGAVTIKTDGKELKVETTVHSPRKRHASATPSSPGSR
jgi:competence protein ComEC